MLSGIKVSPLLSGASTYAVLLAWMQRRALRTRSSIHFVTALYDGSPARPQGVLAADDWRQAARACIHLPTISLSYAVPNNLA